MTEDKRQTELIRRVWDDSGRVYGYRKLHDDLLDQGESLFPNRVARTARLPGISARIGYARRPSSYGGKPSVVIDNTLDRQFDVAIRIVLEGLRGEDEAGEHRWSERSRDDSAALPARTPVSSAQPFSVE